MLETEHELLAKMKQQKQQSEWPGFLRPGQSLPEAVSALLVYALFSSC